MEKNKKLKKRIIVVLSLIVIAFCNISPSRAIDANLKKDYDLYKKDYMSVDGRIMDPQRENATTSEGQAYMLLRSLLMNDKKTFDLVLKWSTNNLQRDDKLFSWLWGKNKNGEYKIIDANPASDADIDIAFALILAHKKWKQKEYLDSARPIINSIWEKETRQIGDYTVLMPGVEQAKSDNIEINPSYFSPYAFKLFKNYDKKHDWNKLVNSSYYYLNMACNNSKIGLPPDWAVIKDGKISKENINRESFSYDAIRVFPRVFLDYSTTKDKRAKAILEKSKFFITQWKNTKPPHTLYTNYLPSGEPKDKNEYLGSIALLLSTINIYDKKVAEEIFKEKLLPKLNEKEYYSNKNDYYGRNLVWFGYYLYKNFRGLK